MSTLPPEPQRSLTLQDINAWLRAAHEQRAQLHRHAASSWYSTERQEAFEEVRHAERRLLAMFREGKKQGPL